MFDRRLRLIGRRIQQRTHFTGLCNISVHQLRRVTPSLCCKIHVSRKISQLGLSFVRIYFTAVNICVALVFQFILAIFRRVSSRRIQHLNPNARNAGRHILKTLCKIDVVRNGCAFILGVIIFIGIKPYVLIFAFSLSQCLYRPFLVGKTSKGFGSFYRLCRNGYLKARNRSVVYIPAITSAYLIFICPPDKF